MASLTFHRELPAHLSRIRIASFQQLVDFLLSSKYTAVQYPALKTGDRERLARSDVADAVKRGKESGHLVVDKQVVARGDNLRALLVFDSSHDADILPVHYQRLYESWRRVGVKRIEAVYSPKNILACFENNPDGGFAEDESIAEMSADNVTAELALSSIYFGLTAKKVDGWESCPGSSPPGFFQSSEGWDPPACVVPFEASAGLRGLEIMVPVIRSGVRVSSASDERVFLDFVRHYMNYGHTPLQIWMPDPESVLP